MVFVSCDLQKLKSISLSNHILSRVFNGTKPMNQLIMWIQRESNIAIY